MNKINCFIFPESEVNALFSTKQNHAHDPQQLRTSVGNRATRLVQTKCAETAALVTGNTNILSQRHRIKTFFRAPLFLFWVCKQRPWKCSPHSVSLVFPIISTSMIIYDSISKSDTISHSLCFNVMHI